MDVDGWGSWGEPPLAGGAPEPACAASSLQLHEVPPGDVSELAARALRVLLSCETVLPHSGLRCAVLGSHRGEHSGSRR